MLALLFLLMIICNWKALKVSIAIIETAADYFADTKRILFVPVFWFIMAIVVFLVWLVGIVCVHSIGTITVESVRTQDKNVVHDAQTQNMILYMWFGLIWLMAFIITCNEFVIIVSTCTWYFSRKDLDDDDGIPGDAEVMKGVKWAFQYHMGSIALGSFLLAVVWMLRAIFEYVAAKVEGAAPGNAAVKCLVWTLRCCLDCFDRFIRFIN